MFNLKAMKDFETIENFSKDLEPSEELSEANV